MCTITRSPPIHRSFSPFTWFTGCIVWSLCHVPGTVCPTEARGFLSFFFVLLNMFFRDEKYCIHEKSLLFFVYLFVFIKCLLYLLGKHVAVYVFLFSPHWANSIQEHGEKSEQPRVDRKGTLPLFRCARNARNARNDRSARSSRNGRKAEHYQHNLKMLDGRTEHYIAAAGKHL